MTRILRILTRPNIGGPMRQAVALWHAGQALGQQTLLLVGRCAADEASFDLTDLGIPLLQAEQVTKQASGIVQLQSLQRAISPLADRRAAKAIERVIARFEPQVLHSHTSKAGWLGRRAGRRLRVPVRAHTFHGHVLRDYFSPFLSSVLLRRERALARNTDLLFAVSESCRAELAELGVSAEIDCLPPAVDCSGLSQEGRMQARELLACEQSPLIAFVGRLVPVKAPGRFLDLLSALPELQGVIFGSGPLEARLRQHPAAARAQWMGTRTDLARFLPACDALVMPSLREGFPVTGVEAAACGVPTLGFAVPGLVDLAAALGSAELVPPESGVPGMAAALRRLLLLDPEQRVPHRAAELVAACEPGVIARELQHRYLQVLSRQGGAEQGC